MLESISLALNRSQSERQSSESLPQLVLIGFLLAILYYVGAQLSFFFRVPSTHSSIIWVPNAVLLSAFLLSPVNKWWLWILVTLPAHLLAQSRDSAALFMLCCPFLANVVQAGIAALVLRHFVDAPWRLNTLRNMAAFIAVAVVAAPAFVSVSAAWFFVLAGWERDYQLVAQARFLSNVITGLTVTPLVLTAASAAIGYREQPPTRKYIELGALSLSLVGMLTIISLHPGAQLHELPLELYAPLPFLLWAAVRCGPTGLSFTLLIVAAHCLYQVLHWQGVFVDGSPAENVLALEISLAMLSVPLLLLSASIQEGREKLKRLAESEARFRMMADTTPALVWMSDTDKLCNFFNKGWLRFTGRTVEQETGHGWAGGVHPDDRERRFRTYERAFDARQPFGMEYRLRRYDGDYRWIIDEGVPRFAPDGSFVGYIGAAMEITERKHAEARLEVQHAIARILSEAQSLTEASPQILQAICESLGWKLGELWLIKRGRMAYESSWHSPLPALKEYVSATSRLTFAPGMGLQGRVWQTRQAQWVRDFLNEDNFLRRSVAMKTDLRSGFAFPILLDDEILGAMVFLGPDVRDPEPKVLEMMNSIGSQIGQFINRKKAEAALRVSEEQLAQAQSSSLVMVTHTDLEGRWLRVPPNLCRLLGYSERELLGRSFEDLTHSDDVGINRDQRARLLRREIESFDLEKRYIKKNGEIVWVYLNVSAVTGADGKPLYFLSYINDITERKRAEEALRENQLRLQLAMDAARIGYWEVDLSTGRLTRSEQLHRVFGMPASRPLHNRDDFLALVHPEDAQHIKTTVARAVKNLSAYSIGYRIVRPDGNVGWIASRGQVLPDAEGRAHRLVGLSTDVTAYKESEEALRIALTELQKLRDRIEAENVYLRSEVARTYRSGEIIGCSEGIQKVLRLVEQVAPTDMAVLILGETGTGKELVARSIHAKSARSERPLVKVNCSALPAELIESELFGHEKGAFTGAVARQVGRFELADRGTIFLDEIGDLPLNLQAKLLRVLQEGEFERVGSATTIRVDVRLIAATNRNLSEGVRSGSFRADLYYRLNVYPISIPPLRDRKEDIVHLATAFLHEAGSRLGKQFDRLPAALVIALEGYHWPGNVRELENVIHRAAVVSAENTLRLPEDWKPEAPAEKDSTSSSSLAMADDGGDSARAATMEDVERRHILRVLEETNWQVEGARGAANILGLQPNTLRSRMKKLGIPTKKDQRQNSSTLRPSD